MIYVAAITGFILLLGNLALFLLIRRQLLARLSAFLELRGENQSEFWDTVDIISDKAGHKVATHLKAFFMGTQGGSARRERAVEGAIAEDVLAQQSPMLSAIAGSFPALSKLIKKNPALADLAQKALSQQGQPEQRGDNGGISEIKDLNQY